MARFILATALEDQARRRPWLHKTLFLLEAGVVYAAYWLLRVLGPERASRLGRRLLAYIGPKSAKHRLLRRNLALAFPERSTERIEALARATWGSIGAVVGEYPHLERIAQEPGRLEVVDRCGLAAYKGPSKGDRRNAVFIGAHLCNWEVLALAAAREGVPLTVLYAPLTNPYLAKLANRARTQLGCGLLSRDASLRPMIKELSSGRSLGILADLRVAEGPRIAFFHHEMETSPTPARLALRYRADLVPVRAERLGDARLRVTFLPPLKLSDASSSDDQAILALTRRINACLETWIREQPDQWLATNRRWDKALYKGSLPNDGGSPRLPEQ
jgi:KDO2-lipid IV(A) lauroyltransferase